MAGNRSDRWVGIAVDQVLGRGPRSRHRPRGRGPDRPRRVSPPPRTVLASLPGEPISRTGDPRWAMAVRTAEQLQGTVLSPEQRQRLLGMGRMLGLSPFDSNLIIAIVQDRARRGFAPTHCPTAAEPQLRMVPAPGRAAVFRTRRGLTVAILIAVMMGLELLLLLTRLF